MTRSQDEILAALPPRLIDAPRRWASETPDAPAVFFEESVHSYAGLCRDIGHAKEHLTRAGIGPGDRVGLVIENCYAAICFFYALSDLEACAVMANARLSEREIGVVLTEADAKAAIFAPSGSAAVDGHAKYADAAPVKDVSFGAVALAIRDPDAKPETVSEDPAKLLAAMLFTSGTTGVPKGAMLTQQTMLYQAAIVAERRKFGPGDCPYVVAPMVHVLGLAGMVVPLIYAGAAMEFAARFDVEAVVEALGQGHLTHLYGAAPMFAAIAGYAKKHGGKIKAPRIKEILAGGAPADEELRATIADIFGMPLGTGYAATECSPISASTPDHPSNPGAVGRPWHGMEMKVVDKDGNDLPRGEVGEVWCRGPNVMDGYFRKPEATAEVMRPGGWVAIGDLAYLDEDGQIHIVGRLKEIINRSGFNVYPAEVEAVLNGYPDVLHSAVVGRKVPDNEEVIAFVEPVPGHHIDPEALAAYAAENLAPYKKPARIIILGALPVGATGKIAKTVLKDRAEALND